MKPRGPFRRTGRSEGAAFGSRSKDRVVLAVGAPIVLLTLLGIWIFRRIRRPKKSMKELLEDLREDEKKDDVS